MPRYHHTEATLFTIDHPIMVSETQLLNRSPAAVLFTVHIQEMEVGCRSSRTRDRRKLLRRLEHTEAFINPVIFWNLATLSPKSPKLNPKPSPQTLNPN